MSALPLCLILSVSFLPTSCRVWPQEDIAEVQALISLVHHVTGACWRQLAPAGACAGQLGACPPPCGWPSWLALCDAPSPGSGPAASFDSPPASPLPSPASPAAGIRLKASFAEQGEGPERRRFGKLRGCVGRPQVAGDDSDCSYEFGRWGKWHHWFKRWAIRHAAALLC